MELAPFAVELGIERGPALLEFIEDATDLRNAESLLFQ
jgi:hypothetical protein